MGGVADRHQDRDGQPARQPLRGRPRSRRVEGRAGLRPVRPHRHHRPATTAGPPGRRSRSRSAGTCTPRPPRRPHHRRHRPGSTTSACSKTGRPAPWASGSATRNSPNHPDQPTSDQHSTEDRTTRCPSTDGPTTTGCVTTPTCSPVAHQTSDGGRRTSRGDRMSLDKLAPSTVSPAPRSAATSPPEMLHRHAGHAEAVARIRWCINETALGVITGEVGAGKTVALRAALAELDASRYTVIYLPNPAVGARGLYTAAGLRPRRRPPVPHRQPDRPDHGPPRRRETRTRRDVIVVIDEAHLLSADQLEELRFLTNSEMDSVAPFTGLLLGQPTLRRRIKLGSFAALDQRIALRYTLPGMTDTETRDYLEPPPQARRPQRPTVQRRRRRPDPPDQPRTATRGEQPRPASPRRDLRRQQNNRRRIRRPRRRRRSHHRMNPPSPPRRPSRHTTTRPRPEPRDGACCTSTTSASSMTPTSSYSAAGNTRASLHDCSPRA